MEIQTPQEAILTAENGRLRAENAWLRRAVERPGLQFTPIAVVEEREMRPMLDEIRLPCVASIEGALSRYGNYHVVAKLMRAEPEDMCIQYHAPAAEIKSKSMYALNNLFPFLHERFIQLLATEIRRVSGARS